MIGIDWDEDGYPSGESIDAFEAAFNALPLSEATDAFYYLLTQNHWGDDFFGNAEREVRGEVIPVFEYHTGGWSGNEEIIALAMRIGGRLPWMMHWQRSDAGGHYYFDARPETAP